MGSKIFCKPVPACQMLHVSMHQLEFLCLWNLFSISRNKFSEIRNACNIFEKKEIPHINKYFYQWVFLEDISEDFLSLFLSGKRAADQCLKYLWKNRNKLNLILFCEKKKKKLVSFVIELWSSLKGRQFKYLIMNKIKSSKRTGTKHFGSYVCLQMSGMVPVSESSLGPLATFWNSI